MKGALVRLVVSSLLAVGVPALTLDHLEPSVAARDGGQLVAHHHGPHSPCPDGPHHCLACAAGSLFAPAPALGRCLPPRVSRVERTRAEGRDGCAERPPALGRSPPAILPLA